MCALVFSYSLPKPYGIMYLKKRMLRNFLVFIRYTKQLVSGTGASPGSCGGDTAKLYASDLENVE